MSDYLLGLGTIPALAAVLWAVSHAWDWADRHFITWTQTNPERVRRFGGSGRRVMWDPRRPAVLVVFNRRQDKALLMKLRPWKKPLRSPEGGQNDE